MTGGLSSKYDTAEVKCVGTTVGGASGGNGATRELPAYCDSIAWSLDWAEG